MCLVNILWSIKWQMVVLTICSPYSPCFASLSIIGLSSQAGCTHPLTHHQARDHPGCPGLPWPALACPDLHKFRAISEGRLAAADRLACAEERVGRLAGLTDCSLPLL